MVGTNAVQTHDLPLLVKPCEGVVVGNSCRVQCRAVQYRPCAIYESRLPSTVALVRQVYSFVNRIVRTVDDQRRRLANGLLGYTSPVTHSGGPARSESLPYERADAHASRIHNTHTGRGQVIHDPESELQSKGMDLVRERLEPLHAVMNHQRHATVSDLFYELRCSRGMI
jgi:hypothetical protein